MSSVFAIVLAWLLLAVYVGVVLALCVAVRLLLEGDIPRNLVWPKLFHLGVFAIVCLFISLVSVVSGLAEMQMKPRKIEIRESSIKQVWKTGEKHSKTVEACSQYTDLLAVAVDTCKGQVRVETARRENGEVLFHEVFAPVDDWSLGVLLAKFEEFNVLTVSGNELEGVTKSQLAKIKEKEKLQRIAKRRKLGARRKLTREKD